MHRIFGRAVSDLLHGVDFPRAQGICPIFESPNWRTYEKSFIFTEDGEPGKEIHSRLMFGDANTFPVPKKSIRILGREMLGDSDRFMHISDLSSVSRNGFRVAERREISERIDGGFQF
jgi:hypothetical protein